MIDLPAPCQGVLSQNLGQHQAHLAAGDSTAFHQADDHPHVLEDLRAGLEPFASRSLRRGRSLGLGPIWPALAWRAGREKTPALIELFLSLFALGAPVIGGASAKGLSPPMLLSATKGAPHAAALMQIARVRQKQNAATRTAGPAGTQLRLGAEGGSQNQVVFQHQPGYRPSPIPLRPKLKMLCDPGCKSAKLWLRMLILKRMSPSYPIGTPVSSG